jgi:hypothetical protein
VVGVGVTVHDAMGDAMGDWRVNSCVEWRGEISDGYMNTYVEIDQR